MIQFLNEDDVRTVYNQIPKEKYKKEEIERNVKKNSLLFYQNNDNFVGIEITFNEKGV